MYLCRPPCINTSSVLSIALRTGFWTQCHKVPVEVFLAFSLSRDQVVYFSFTFMRSLLPNRFCDAYETL